MFDVHCSDIHREREMKGNLPKSAVLSTTPGETLTLMYLELGIFCLDELQQQ